MQQAQKLMSLGSIFGATIGGIFLIDKCRFNIEPGNVGLLFSKFTGLSELQYREGWHLRIPYFQRPIIYNVQTRPKAIKAQTANKDMQTVALTVRVLFKPDPNNLAKLYREIGPDFDDRVLPSIVNEVLRSVIAQYTASQLLSMRDQVSSKIRRSLDERAAKFHIIIDDVSITDLAFGKDYQQSVEAKQVAQQEAERAKFLVQQALDIKKSIIIKAQAEAKSIELVGKVAAMDASYLNIKRIEYSKEIAQILAESRNNIMLNSEILMMNTNTGASKKAV